MTAANPLARWCRRAAAALLPLLLLAAPGGAAAQEEACPAGGGAVIADLSSHAVTVDARFTGAEVIVFGVIECPGDVVVTMRGPRRGMVVREKTKLAGIWVNGRSVTFSDAPILYAAATTAPLEEILPETVRQARGIGVDGLSMGVERAPEDVGRFRGALIHYQQQRALYSEPLKIDFIGRKLFRTSIWFPASVPTGQYIADVFLVRDQAVIGAHSMALSVYRGGFEARIYDVAHDQPAIYGLAAVLAAAGVGWIVGMLFQRP